MFYLTSHLHWRILKGTDKKEEKKKKAFLTRKKGIVGSGIPLLGRDKKETILFHF
jgi:hypothetical protein